MITKKLPSVFISYKWEKSTEKLINDLISKIDGKTANVVIDKKSAPQWASLETFMKKISKTNFAILFVSDAYIKSLNCLFEVSELMKDDNWKKKTMIVIMPTAGKKLYETGNTIEWIEYWDKVYEDQDKKFEKVKSNASGMLERQRLLKIQQVRTTLELFLMAASDTKNADKKNALELIEDRLKSKTPKVKKQGVTSKAELSRLKALWSNIVPLKVEMYNVAPAISNIQMRDVITNYQDKINSLLTQYNSERPYLSEKNRNLFDNLIYRMKDFSENSLLAWRKAYEANSYQKAGNNMKMVECSIVISKVFNANESIMSYVEQQYIEAEKAVS